jgi:acetolactate decarboxylase
MFCFFKADTVLKISAKSNQQEIEQLITNALNNKNGIYAIRISGSFEQVKTRAFHKVDQEPFPPVAEIQAAQQVFTFDEVKGTIFGYYMPVYMTGISGTGYHFHFLSEGRDKGGHILSYAGKSITVEIARIVNASLSIPNDVAFQNFIQSNSK